MAEKIEANIASRNISDKIMWFSMWFLLTVVTFGAVGPVMMYYLVKRRNDHFKRITELQDLMLCKPPQFPSGKSASLNTVTSDVLMYKSAVKSRNALAWAILSLLIFPSLYVLYFLTKDLHEHKESEHSLFAGITLMFQNFNAGPKMGTYGISKDSYGTYRKLTILTFCFVSPYWFYRIFNDYNYHFKMQWEIEDQLLRYLRNASP